MSTDKELLLKFFDFLKYTDRAIGFYGDYSFKVSRLTPDVFVKDFEEYLKHYQPESKE